MDYTANQLSSMSIEENLIGNKQMHEDGILKDNVFYFNTPVKANLFDFMSTHNKCDVLIRKRNNKEDLDVEVVAYAEGAKYNYKLANKFSNNTQYEICANIGWNEVGGLW